MDSTSVGAAPCAVVTGGGQGIGAAIATAWVAAGGRVVVSDVEDAPAHALVERLGPAADYVHADVTSEAEVVDLLDHAARTGPPAAVFANAGAAGASGPIDATDLDAWRRTLDLVLTGSFLTTKHAVRVMRPAGAGAIVCTASVASLRGGLGPHAYTAAKHGVKGLVESVAAEVAPLGLRINGVAPGGTVSALTAAILGDDGADLDTATRVLAGESASGVPTTPEDVAAAALFLASPSAARINGILLPVEGGDALLGRSTRGYHRAR